MTVKERNLVKGALRRVFSRSNIRQEVVAASVIPGHHVPSRPRVKKWSICASCKEYVPTYQLQVDHREPLIPLNKNLEDLSWDEIIERLWCAKENLQALCSTCHDKKSTEERKQRLAIKKAKGSK